MVKHATADLPTPTKTLCSEPLHVAGTTRTRVRVDNADPDCKRCLRSIARAIRTNREPVE
jgi:hypothetical protein